jgi:hypothetical protein
VHYSAPSAAGRRPYDARDWALNPELVPVFAPPPDVPPLPARPLVDLDALRAAVARGDLT